LNLLGLYRFGIPNLAGVLQPFCQFTITRNRLRNPFLQILSMLRIYPLQFGKAFWRPNLGRVNSIDKLS
jgi:hypothetical protein